MVDTIEALFTGDKPLFKGLWIEDKWDFDNTNPVIRFSLANLGVITEGLEQGLFNGLRDNAERLGITLTEKPYDRQFGELIRKVATEKGKVVILIDEYDKPLIENLENKETLNKIHQVLRNFYSVLKDSDVHIKFLLMTGVTQFSGLSVFSDLNNLDDITLSNQFGDLVGITQQELEENFASEIRKLEKVNPSILEKLKNWYNGYSWDLKTRVYNPYSIMKFMRTHQFKNYWYATGAPKMLLEQLKKKNIFEIKDIYDAEDSLTNLYLDAPSPWPLLFQTGYITLKSLQENGLYQLGYPNKEVQSSLQEGLLSIYRGVPLGDSRRELALLKSALENADIELFRTILDTQFASIPYDYWNADTESIFNIITFISFRSCGLTATPEVHTSKGRSDLLVETDKYIYIII